MPSAPSVKRGFSPLDEELGLLAGSLTPRLQGHIARLGSWLPFDKARHIARDLLRVTVSKSSMRRGTEKHGAAYEAQQTAQVAQLEAELPEPPRGPAKQLMSVDGALVPLVGGEWAEVKTLGLGEVEDKVDKEGQIRVCSSNLSYFSRLTDSDTFQRLALVETHRRGVETAQQVAAVADGAVWIQGFIDFHRTDAVRILDYGHAAEYVATIGRGGAELEKETFTTWLHTSLHTLKHKGATALLPELRTLVAQQPEATEMAEALTYLEKRTAQMQYPEFQTQGWPIGSGSVESANKLVVEVRLKGAGMHWAPDQVNPMLTLRNAVCNDRWDEAWGEIVSYYQQQRKQRFRDRAHHHSVAPLPPPLIFASDTQPTPPVETSSPKQPWRPPADHPWKRSPSCTPSRRSLNAKK